MSVDGGRRVSVDEQVLLSIDAVRLSLRIGRSKRAGSDKSSLCSFLLLKGVRLRVSIQTIRIIEV